MKKIINNLEGIAKTLSVILIIMLPISMLALMAPVYMYYVKNIEMFWLINTSFVMGMVTFAVFLLFIGAIAAMWIRDEKEEEKVIEG